MGFMATLATEDLKAVKGLIEEAIDTVFEKKDLANRNDLNSLLRKDVFFEGTGKILQRIDDLKALAQALNST